MVGLLERKMDGDVDGENVVGSGVGPVEGCVVGVDVGEFVGGMQPLEVHTDERQAQPENDLQLA